MTIKKSIRRLLIIELILLVGWCVIVLAFADFNKAGFYFWGGLGFGLMSFLVAGVSLLTIKTTENESTTEINFIPVYYTAVYLLVSLIINTYFMFRRKGKLNTLLLMLDIFTFIIFVSIKLFTDNYIKRVDKQTRHLADKTNPIIAISSQLAVMISVTTDNDIKNQLLTLKETVDYSTNLTQGFSVDSQNHFLLQLNQIHSMIIENKDKEEIKKKIQEAATSWKIRNSVASTIR